MQHPPYTIPAYLGAGIWIGSFLSSAVLVAVIDSRLRLVISVVVGFLLFTRFWLPGFAFRSRPVLPSELFQLETPVLIAGCLYVLAELLLVARSACSTRPTTSLE